MPTNVLASHAQRIPWCSAAFYTVNLRVKCQQNIALARLAASIEWDITTTTPSPSLETDQSDATVSAQAKVTDCRTADSSSWTGASALSAPTTSLLIKARPWPTIIPRRKPLIVNFHTTLSDAWLSAELWTNALVLKPTKQKFNTLPLMWVASERKENIRLQTPQLLRCQWGSRY